MQMLFDGSVESPGVAGLGVIPGEVRWIEGDVKRPQIQWNVVRSTGPPDPLLAGLGEEPWFYFVHSLHGCPDDPGAVVATCDYGGPVNAVFRAGAVAAVQFHPEKSAAAGLGLLANFVAGVAVTVLYPSIDLRAGRVVRLAQGDYDRETVYGDDAVDAASAFVEGGAVWIHVVDLDAARSGVAANRAAIAAIAAATAGRAEVQAGGGVRTVDDAAALFDAGVARVVMGSAAVADPALVDRVAARVPVAVGLDHRAGVLAVEGWTQAADVTVDAALARYPAASAFVVTDISRDGMLVGADLDGLARLRRRHRPPGDRQRRRGIARRRRGAGGDRRPARRDHRSGALRGPLHRRRRDRHARRAAGNASDGAGETVRECVRATRRQPRSGQLRPAWPGNAMMVARVIPCLDVTGGRVVKGTNFVGLRDAGDPVELAARYDAEGADELVFLDITASSDGRDTTVDMVYRVAEQVFIPFTVGGGVRTVGRRPAVCCVPARTRSG